MHKCWMCLCLCVADRLLTIVFKQLYFLPET